MVEATWPELGGKELRYRDHTWRLTGDVDVRDGGRLVAAEAERVDGVRHETATLHFGLRSPPDSLNPGNMRDHFDRLERTPDGQFLVVRTDPRTYRYELERLTYE